LYELRSMADVGTHLTHAGVVMAKTMLT